MNLYELGLILSAQDIDPNSIPDRIIGTGLEGASSTTANGAILLTIARRMPNFSTMIIATVEDVLLLGARVESLEPHYLVGAKEIASRLGITAAAITHRQQRGGASAFPPPVCRVLADRPLYDWFEIASWAYQRGKLDWVAVRHAIIMREANLLVALYRNSPAELAAKLRRSLPALEAGLDVR
jgi:hypothetical protein